MDTLSDIELLVEAKAKSVLLENDEDRASLVKRILKKGRKRVSYGQSWYSMS